MTTVDHREESVDAFGCADVGADPNSVRPKLPRRDDSLIVMAGVDHDVGTFGREGSSDGAADSASRTGYHRDLGVKLHTPSVTSWGRRIGAGPRHAPPRHGSRCSTTSGLRWSWCHPLVNPTPGARTRKRFSTPVECARFACRGQGPDGCHRSSPVVTEPWPVSSTTVLGPGAYMRKQPPQPVSAETLGGLPGRHELEAARELISSRVWKTPLMPSRQLSADAQRSVHLKLECLASIRSFKARGAIWSLAALRPDQRNAGVITASTGNHGQGVAYAGRLLGTDVTVVSPHTLDPVKRGAMESLGATVLVGGGDINAASDLALQMARERGLTYIEDGEDTALLAGAATVLWEMLDERPELDSVVVPVGGGNLIASCLWLAAVLDRTVAITGVQSTMAPGATLSWLNGVMTPVECRTSAGGLATSRPGALALSVMNAYLETMILVEEQQLADGISYAVHNEGIVVEPAAAAGIAALRTFARHVPGEMTGVILTGGWISASDLARCVRAR